MVDLSFSRLQTALFLTSLDSTRMLELATAIRNAAGGLLDADPMMLPLPSDSPPEIPRLTLRSSDRQWACQVSGNRLDLVFELSPDDLGTADFPDTAERQAHICSGIWKAIESEYGASGRRIGIVSTFLGVPGNAAQFLREMLLLPARSPDPHELQLHVLHNMFLGGTMVNRWTRCIGSTHIPIAEKEDIVRVEIDVNTLSEQSYPLNASSIHSFTEGTKELVLSTISALFEENSSGERIF